MKKPEKKNGIRIISIPYDEGFDKAIDLSDKYHEWDKKQNYIHKDRLSVRIKEMVEVYGVDMGGYISITHKRLEELATELSKKL